MLKHLKYPHYSYASHMPQVINKGILAKSAAQFKRFTEEIGLCEWSTYFNFAHRDHPGLFHTPSVYKTSCWPDCTTCWPKSFEPEEYLFENYSPSLSLKNGPFTQFDKISADGHDGFRKVLSCYKHELKVRQSRIPDNPTLFGKLMYRLVRHIRRLNDVMALRDQASLLALSDRINSIEKAISKMLNRST